MISFDPPAAKQRAKCIKVFFVADGVTGQMFVIRAACGTIIMAQCCLFGKITHPCIPDAIPKLGFPVNDRRHGPFQDVGISLRKCLQGLFEIPAVDIQYFIKLPLDHVFFRINSEVLFGLLHVNKAYIIIAVRRRESPRPASRLRCQENCHLLFRLYGIEMILYFSLYVSHEISSRTACRFISSTSSSILSMSGLSGRVLALSASSKRSS